MKIALCMFGNVGHTVLAGARKEVPGFDSMKEAFKPKGAWVHPKRARDGFKKFIIDQHDTDVFIHSWSTNFKDELLEMYEPQDHEIVEQTKFGSDVSKYGLVGQDMAKWKLRPSTMESYKLLLSSRGSVQAVMDDMQDLSFRSESRWWSSKRVLEQKKKCEQKHGFKYDFVVLSRLDNVFKRTIPFNTLGGSKFYGSKRHGRPDQMYAYFDFWFISGSENMNKFAGLYDNRHNYSVRPTFACREHVVQTLGNGAVAFLFTHNNEYSLARDA